MFAVGQLLDVVRRLALVHGPERDVAQEEETRVVGPACVAVVGRLAHHVGEVDALAEHVTGDWGLGRGDSQALKLWDHFLPAATARWSRRQHAGL